MLRSRGFFVFLLGLTLSLVTLTYWHAHRVVLPELEHLHKSTNNVDKMVLLRRTHRIHNTRIDPDSVVLRPLVTQPDEKMLADKRNRPTTTRPTRPGNPGLHEGNIKVANDPPTTISPPVNVTVSAGWPTLSQLVNLIPKPKAANANCEKLFDNDADEIKRVFQNEEKHPKVPVPDEEYVSLTKNCEEFKKSRSYITHALSKEEEDFPIAFSIMLFKDVEQVERLLRAIYMPQNHYCIHVDAKSSPAIQNSIKAIAECFDNVFLASRQLDVQWGEFSVLEADLICMEDLYMKYKKWRYFINLTGQEFPIKTNLDLVNILKILNGAVVMEGTESK